MPLISTIFLYLIVISGSVIPHELGHWLMYQHYKIKSKIIFYSGYIEIRAKNHDDLTVKQFYYVIVAGVVMGYVYIIFMSELLNMSSYVLLTVYLISCSYDFQILFKMLKNRKQSKNYGSMKIKDVILK